MKIAFYTTIMLMAGFLLFFAIDGALQGRTRVFYYAMIAGLLIVIVLYAVEIVLRVNLRCKRRAQ